MHELYRNIKRLRLANNMTQDDLARKMGYADRSIIAKIEHGDVDLSISKAERFAEVFDVLPEVLCYWTPEKEQDEEQGKAYTPSHQSRADQVTQRIISSFQQAVDMSDGSMATGELQANMLADISLTLAMIYDKMGEPQRDI